MGVRLLRPTAGGWEWQSGAACSGSDSSLFYGPQGESAGTRRWRERQARALCASCPVVMACAEFALAAGERHGIWGGLTETERSILAAGGRVYRPAAG
ncbi:WhiB family transcriptional regulator [Streptomyces sp. NPDC058469]|uniref:WhiB family transcriptional regulator n=1 Tax=Streptomyces sp. NPDC058469 TaxID=3346514 RepID=UPI00365DF65E